MCLCVSVCICGWGGSLSCLRALQVGRAVANKARPTTDNAIFDSKVLSRTHAEIWADNGRVSDALHHTTDGLVSTMVLTAYVVYNLRM